MLIGLIAAFAGCSPSPTPPASSPASASSVTFSCSLPISNVTEVNNGGSTSSTVQNGFLSMPSGKFTPDPSLKQGAAYDWAYKRWVPVPMAMLLPDGSAYAFETQLPDGRWEVHLVQMATGADTEVYRMSYENSYDVIAFRPEGIYVWPILHMSGLASGLFLIDTKTRALDPVPTSLNGTWQIVTDGAAWGGPGGRAGDSLVRLDLSTGTETTWFQHRVEGGVFEGFGLGVSIFGLDGAGEALVEVFPPINEMVTPAPTKHPEVWLVSAPGHATRLSGLPLPVDQALEFGVTDAHGVWVVGADGVYLYANSVFTRVAALPPHHPTATSSGASAGSLAAA